jgi:hypothetical protein
MHRNKEFHILCTGANVMITVFGDFETNLLRKKLKTNIMIYVWHKIAEFLVKIDLFPVFFGKNISKIITSTPGKQLTTCDLIQGGRVDLQRSLKGQDVRGKHLFAHFRFFSLSTVVPSINNNSGRI